jgi:hypothetical protein
LISKKRDGAKITKKYDKAKTPYQRLLASTHISEETKTKLQIQYEQLDPVLLLKDLQNLQDNFWKHAWKRQIQSATTKISVRSPVNEAILSQVHECVISHSATSTANKKPTKKKITKHIVNLEHQYENNALLENNPFQAKYQTLQIYKKTWETTWSSNMAY